MPPACIDLLGGNSPAEMKVGTKNVTHPLLWGELACTLFSEQYPIQRWFLEVKYELGQLLELWQLMAPSVSSTPQGGERGDRTGSASCSGRYAAISEGNAWSSTGLRPDTPPSVFDAVYVPVGVTLPRSRSGIANESPSPMLCGAHRNEGSPYTLGLWSWGGRPKDHHQRSDIQPPGETDNLLTLVLLRARMARRDWHFYSIHT